MPRVAKPYSHRGWFVSKAGGKINKLCPVADGIGQAKKILRGLQVGLDNSPVPIVHGGGMTVGQLMFDYLQAKEVRLGEKTMRDYRYCLDGWCKWRPKGEGPIMGERLVSSMTPALLEAWIVEAKKAGKAGTTINHFIRTLQGCWSWWIQVNQGEGKNPFRYVKKLPSSHRERVMTPDEFRLQLRMADPLFRQISLFYRLTGLRPTELTEITWDMVDLPGAVLVIPAELTKTGRLRLTRTGKAGPDRVVPLCPCLVKLLCWRLARCSGEGYVFTNRFGRRFTYCSIVQRFKRLRKRCGFTADERGENLVMYSSRHTFATSAAENGIGSREIGSLLGHTPGSPITEVYINLAKSKKYQQGLHDAAKLATVGAMGQRRVS